MKKKTENQFGSKANLVENEGKNEDLDPRMKEEKINMGSPIKEVDPAMMEDNLEDRVLTPDEKSFLLCVERGDVSTAKGIIKAMIKRVNIFDMNCVDPLGRSSLIIAVENENPDMMDMLLEHGIKTKDALLVAIREDYVDGVEILLKYEEEHHKEGEPYSWESMDNTVANFTADITPLILAAHRNNYEILKMLLDRGATIPLPHDVKCSCDECLKGSVEDSLKFSLARINSYRALASPSLIALSSSDPILTAFQLSDELKKLARAESQFREEYIKLRKQVQEFVTGLIDQTRTSYELEVILNHNPDGDPWEVGDFQTLERLKLAIKYKQKGFVAHPSVQQLLAAIWYEGLPGFRRKNIIKQILDVLQLACMFPINSMLYVMAPHSTRGKYMRNPFVKFVSHSASYLFFLTLLALASQRIEHVIIQIIVFLFPETVVGIFLAQVKANWDKYERGSLPHFVELAIIMWVQGLVWTEIKAFFKDGLITYITNLWNLANIFSYGAFLSWIGLRTLSWLIVQKERWDGVDPDLIWIPKEEWHPFEPQLLAEAMFCAGMISSYLKVVHILSINPYLGPLQIALGKMIIDIIKWMFLYCLVVFAFGCGMNQLLWYYADLEKQKCYHLPGGMPDFDEEGDSCIMWRRFANLWEASQSLFWASFGLVDLGDFELTGIKEFTRFFGLLMFGCYSIINIIVLLNMLIAMMSNSYQIIFERSDVEWKFSRSKLWISYFHHGGTVPTPFNLIPTPKSMMRILCCKKVTLKDITEEERVQAKTRYTTVMKYVIRRYITSEQRKSEDFSITEDDIQEVRQDINSFKYELMDILKANNMKVPDTKRGDSGIMGRKSKNMERQIQKGFQITKIEGVMEAFFTASTEEKPKDVFKRFAKLVNEKSRKRSIEDESARRSSIKRDPIGHTQNSIKRHRNSLKRSLFQRGNSQAEIKMVLTRLNSEELVAFNPHLSEYAPAARRAYAKFKTALDNYNDQYGKPNEVTSTAVKKRDSVKSTTSRDSIRRLIIEKAKSIDSNDTQATINKSVANLEKILDKEDIEKQSTGTDGKTTVERKDEETKQPPADSSNIGGQVNQGFVSDGPELMVSHPSIDEGGASPTPSLNKTKTPQGLSPNPSPKVSKHPSPQPSPVPSRKATPQPSPQPSAKGSVQPSPAGSAHPSPQPSAKGSAQPTPQASAQPTPQPSAKPTPQPSAKPTPLPSAKPSPQPSAQPTPQPSAKPTPQPSPVPSTRGVGLQPDSGPSAQASPAKTPAKSPAKTPRTPRAASPAVPAEKKEEVPEGQFDPEGRSAVSGQRRTGWI